MLSPNSFVVGTGGLCSFTHFCLHTSGLSLHCILLEHKCTNKIMSAKVECCPLILASASVEWDEWMFGMTCGCSVISITIFCFVLWLFVSDETCC